VGQRQLEQPSAALLVAGDLGQQSLDVDDFDAAGTQRGRQRVVLGLCGLDVDGAREQHPRRVRGLDGTQLVPGAVQEHAAQPPDLGRHARRAPDGDRQPCRLCDEERVGCLHDDLLPQLPGQSARCAPHRRQISSEIEFTLLVTQLWPRSLHALTRGCVASRR
jgi:hypothetical protein